MKKKLFCIVGKTGSGKSTLLNTILNDRFLSDVVGIEPFVYSTTRPMRKDEVDGRDYNFRSYEYYQELKQDEVIENRTYKTKNNGYVHYFTTIHDFKTTKSNILICAASANQVRDYINYSKDNKELDVYIINIHSTTRDRMIRILNNRNTDDTACKELCRRILEEDKEYSTLTYSLNDGIYKQYPDRIFLDLINNGTDSYNDMMFNMLYKVTDFILDKCKDI